MSKPPAKALVVMTVLAVAVSVFGCGGGSGGASGPGRSNYVTYVDDLTGEKFLVPWSDDIYPPIVNPKTGQRTLVRAYVYTPKDGGPPRAFYYEKYTDAQIKAMNEYAKTAKPDMLAEMPPDMWLSTQNEGPLQRRPDGKWVTFQQLMADPSLMPNLRREAKSFIVETPDDWGEKLEKDQVKQW